MADSYPTNIERCASTNLFMLALNFTIFLIMIHYVGNQNQVL